jgi:hypothetical protein
VQCKHHQYKQQIVRNKRNYNYQWSYHFPAVHFHVKPPEVEFPQASKAPTKPASMLPGLKPGSALCRDRRLVERNDPLVPRRTWIVIGAWCDLSDACGGKDFGETIMALSKV